MPILSFPQYILRWIDPHPIGFNQGGVPHPNYYEYVQRKIYEQDYLDLFIHTATFARINIAGSFYVQVTGNPMLVGLGIGVDGVFSIAVGGTQYLIVDYDYPWTAKELTQQRWIRYIGIGEAAPSPEIPLVGYGLPQNNNSYFYNIIHVSRTQPWLSAPIGAFGIIGIPDKKYKLLALAEAGYILVDLFPFATEYGILRAHLIAGGVCNYYWDNIHNAYSLQAKLALLANYFYQVYAYPKGCLVSSPTINHHLANQINGVLIGNLGCNFRLGNNNFLPLHYLHGAFHFISITLGSNLIGIGGLIYHLPPNNAGTFAVQIPIYSCCGITSAGSPSSLLMRNCLGL